ncbi:MAG TPA: 3D domain-containing protein [Gaiellaceae bacterium]|nr:3D domain-containing protein [Gaiellaceae bacterium]
MLGQAHTPRRRFLPFAAIALAVMTAPAVGGASPSHAVSTLRARDAQIAARSRSAVLGLYSLDRRLARADAQLAALEHEAGSLRAERASLRRQIHAAQRGTRIAQRELARRVRALYEQGNVEPIEILFGARTLDEAVSGIDSLSSVSAQGEEVLAELKAAKERLTAAARALASREAALVAARRDAEATARTLASARVQRTTYIASLAAKRRLTQSQIAALLARARAAESRTETLVAAAPATAPAAEVDVPGPAPGARTLAVSATGYALGGTTSTGLPVGWGVAAVDPSVIPLGTHMTVPGYGEAVAADTGGAVSGATIDLWFPSIAQANAWGRRTVTVVLH